MAFPSYSTGTVSVSAGGTVVTGVGTLWTDSNVRPGDEILIAGREVVVMDFTDSTHLVINPWQGTSVSGVSYGLIQSSPLRYNASQVMMDVSQIVAVLNTDGYYYNVPATAITPNPSYGNEGQYALQATTGKLWVKETGVWVYVGTNKGFGLPAPYDSGKTYNQFDVATFGGSSYVFINNAPSAGHAPPNSTYWVLLASIGTPGADATVAVGTVTTLAGGAAATVANSGTSGAAILNFGIPQGKSYAATSATSLAVGMGSKVFTTQAGLAYTNGARVRASSSSNTANWMEGLATYSGTTLTISVTKTNGSGTLADWNLNLAGEPGAGDLSAVNALSELTSVAVTARSNIGAAAAATADENAYWKDQAALLDPAAYIFWRGANWSVTVPAGETWYVVNAWNARIQSSALWYHRDLATDEAFPVPAGTVLSGGTTSSFLYVCRPALVTAAPAYSDAKNLYYSRLNTLRSYVLNKLDITISAGAANNALGSATFPTDFNDGLMANVSAMDVAWVIMATSLGEGSLNTLGEISDRHNIRYTNKLMTPWVRASFPGIFAQASNAAGNFTDAAIAGYGVMTYYKLPSGWRTASPLRAYRAAVLADNPTIYLPCDDVTGTTATNLGSASSISGAYVANAKIGSIGATGDGGTSVFFPDATSRLTIPSNSTLNFGASDFTIEMWVNFASLPTSAATNNPWVYNAWVTPTVNTQLQMLMAVNNNKLALTVYSTDATTATVTSTINLVVDTYYHVIFGRSGSNIFIRVVGKETRQNTAYTKTLFSRSSEAFWISMESPYAVNGLVDEFAVYGVLSDARADAHHALALGWQ